MARGLTQRELATRVRFEDGHSISTKGQRDHALLSFLYNTGARIQEALEVRPQAIRFDAPACVRLYGNGRKELLCPLWPETVSLLR
jgi:site-specific recombinase XerD